MFLILGSPRQAGSEGPGRPAERTGLRGQRLGAARLPKRHRAGRRAAKITQSKQVRYTFSNHGITNMQNLFMERYRYLLTLYRLLYLLYLSLP